VLWVYPQAKPLNDRSKTMHIDSSLEYILQYLEYFILQQSQFARRSILEFEILRKIDQRVVVVGGCCER